MTKVVFYQREDGFLTGFQATGHAEYAEWGKDIVCAAISALTQATILGLEEVIHAKVTYQLDDRRALAACRIQPDTGAETLEKAQVLLRTLKIALNAIAQSHPGTIRIINGERR